MSRSHQPERVRVAEMRGAIVAALERQHEHPEEGVEALQRRYPAIQREDALEGGSLVAPTIFTGVRPGTMTAERWAATIDVVSAARGLPPAPPDQVYRPALAAAPVS